MVGAAIHFALNIHDIDISDSIVANNFARLWGAGLYFEENVRTVRITNTTFTNNYAWGHGGGLFFGACGGICAGAVAY